MDVIIKATGKKNSTYWMRSQISQGDGCAGVRHPDSAQALAVVFYDNAPPLSVPTSKPYTFPDPCLDAPIALSEPVYKITPSAKAATTFELNIGFGQNATGNFVWNVNNSSFVVDFNNPALLAAHNGRTDFPRSWNLYDTFDNKTTRFVVINNSPASHPMHLHGNPSLSPFPLPPY
jgi:FtsP/CotA-like multicopper oxidase with cupredoxin domain